MSSHRLWKFRVRHILEAIRKVENYTAGLDASGLAATPMALDAVIRNFQVIGEASRNVPDKVKEANPQVPWLKMERMRHVLVHDYNRVDVEVVWRTIQEDLPPLVPLLERLLEESEE